MCFMFFFLQAVCALLCLNLFVQRLTVKSFLYALVLFLEMCLVCVCGSSGDGDLFISPLSVLSSTMFVSPAPLPTTPPLCPPPPPALLFSRHTCRPRGEGGLLPFGQLREAVFAPSVCPAEQTALLLQCGQSLGPSL